MYSNQISEVSAVESEPTKTAKNGNSSWYVAMAKAWGNALDKQSQKLVDESLVLNNSTSVGDATFANAASPDHFSIADRPASAACSDAITASSAHTG